MAIVTTALQSLINEGNDAQGKLFEAVFSGGTLPDDTANLTVRCSGFTPSLPTQSTYSVSFVTAKIERPTTKVDLTRNFSLTFRVDDNWYLYKELLNQQKVTMNASKSFVNTNMSDIMDSLFNVRINRIINLSTAKESPVERLFNYNYCWLSEISSPDFSSGDASAETVTCKINFLQMEDWQSGLTDNESDATTKSAMDYTSSTTYV